MKETKDPAEPTLPSDSERIVERVRERYGRIVSGEESGCCSTTSLPCCEPDAGAVARQMGYDSRDLEAVPEGANLGLGCGAPIAQLDLEAGETVLDLGSGGGFDALLAAARVGAGGRVIGVDMTEEMVERARENAEVSGVAHAEFRLGRLESLPVDDASVDAVTSNCVINLVPDKARVFREVARVLKPGGRLVVSDIVLDSPLPEALARDLLAYIGCVAGALERERYFSTVADAGLEDVEVLRDVDFLAASQEALPEDVAELLDRTGANPEELQGKVRSVTFRAWRPA